MLPEKIYWDITMQQLYYRENVEYQVLDTELLHLCWLVEETLDDEQKIMIQIYELCDLEGHNGFASYYHATWQQRTIACAKVKGIEI